MSDKIKDYLNSFLVVALGVMGFFLFKKSKESSVTEGKLAEVQSTLKTQENDNATKNQDSITQSALDAFHKSDSSK